MTHEPRSCATCGELGCAMNKLHRVGDIPGERTAWVLDGQSPEIASMVAASFASGDQLIAPGVYPGWPRRYRWPVITRHPAPLATVRRHWAMHRVAKETGAVRQRSYIEQDRLVACSLGRQIDYRARHLVIAQAWLTGLEEAGALGGRAFDVVMSRYPLGEIHRLLDAAAAEIGSSATIADFRADDELVAREADLLRRARRIYTPHHGIAALFPGQAWLLAWHKPAARCRRAGSRVAFLGPSIARQRPDIVRRLASELQEPLIVFGPILEPSWDGLEIERREIRPEWFDDIGAILHPASITHEPHLLLEAVANGITVYATETCGLDPADYRPLTEFSAAGAVSPPQAASAA